MKLKQIGVMLLAMLLVLSMLVSCNVSMENGGTTTADSGKEETPPKEQVESINLIDQGLSGYRIVYPLAKTDWEYDMAIKLQSAIKQLTGIELTVMSDLEFEDEPHTMRQEKEILIGETNRSDEYTVPADAGDINLGYTMFVAYERFVILGNSHMGMYTALRQFILDQFNYDLDDYHQDVTQLPQDNAKRTVTLHHTYFKKATLNSDYFSNMNVMLADFRIKHDGSYLQKRVAHEVKDYIKEATGITLKVGNASVTEGTPMIKFRRDSSLEKGTWEITAEDKTLTVSANGYYGFYDAAKYFKEAIDKYGHYNFAQAASGDYIDGATGLYEATKYAYDKQGDMRVMFLNVLFGSSASSGSGSNKVTYSVPPAERNALQAHMIGEYLPDVLGCQEFNNTKRGYTADGKGGLVELLAELGYQEAVDPRVKNAYGTDQIIPDSAQWGSMTYPEAQLAEDGSLYGYGVGGATEVTYNGETYYTFFNNTPIFYNTNTTEKIDAGYYWYKNQWDKITGVEHSNSAMDCGSKAATWGVFQNKATGDRYIVISTHMCTRSDYVRGLQAQEIVALVEDLVAEYNCPVFFGGDMNGNIGDANYDLFVDDTVGYKSLQDHDVATDYTSKLFAAHGYPNYDNDLGIMTPGKNDESKVHNVKQSTNQNSIDQIFVTNNENVDISIFCVLVDDLTLSSSDHLPIFTDFSIN